MVRVTYLRREPYAVILHVRICAGGGDNVRPYRNRRTTMESMRIA